MNDEAEGQRCQESKYLRQIRLRQPFERENLLLHRTCEGASADRVCLTPVSVTCSRAREASARC